MNSREDHEDWMLLYHPLTATWCVTIDNPKWATEQGYIRFRGGLSHDHADDLLHVASALLARPDGQQS